MDRAARAGKILGVALIVAAPVAIHLAITTSTWTQLVVVIPAVELLILGAIGLMRDPARIKWMGPLAVLLALGILWAERSGLSLTALPGIPHALAYSALLFTFARSLLPGHEAILTRVVTAVRGPLPPEIIVHSRRVTFAWSVFFAAQLVASAALYCFAPLETWSFFINVLNLPLVVLMFVGDGLYRFFRFRNVPLDSLSDIIRLVAKTTEAGARQADSV